MACKGVCPQYKVKRNIRISYMSQGLKWCNRCETYMKWEGTYCPCCHQKMRIRAHNGPNRTKYVAEEVKRI